MIRFQPRFEPLEAREVPAALSFRLADGSIGSALFSTPNCVDPAQSSQSLAVTDLAVVKGGASYVTQPGATANYTNGVLVGVVATATGPGAPINLNNGIVTVGGYVAPVAYDAADTMVAFMLADGTLGAISCNIDWNAVNPDIASQAIPATAFNLNMGGQNFAYGSANYTIPPTLLFANGEFTGFNFALNTNTAPGFAYTSVSTNGLNVTAIAAGTGQQFFAAAEAKVSALIFDFSDIGVAGYTYQLTVSVGYAEGAAKAVTFTVEKNTTRGGLRDAIYSVLKDEGVVVEALGDNRLLVKGTAANNMKTVVFQATKDPTAMLRPSIMELKQAGIVKTADVTPEWVVRQVNP